MYFVGTGQIYSEVDENWCCTKKMDRTMILGEILVIWFTIVVPVLAVIITYYMLYNRSNKKNND